MELLVKLAHYWDYPMIYFYESEDDLAIRGQGCLADASNMFEGVENVTGMDIADFIEATYVGEVNSGETEQEENEHREDRYEQMASRFGCWFDVIIQRGI